MTRRMLCALALLVCALTSAEAQPFLDEDELPAGASGCLDSATDESAN